MRNRPRIILFLSAFFFVVAFSEAIYGNTFGPVIVSQPTTKSVEVSKTTDLVTTAGTLRRTVTYNTIEVSTYGYSGPSCPYGGVYYASIYTSFCGWQYDVCVTFDYNCGNDYHAVQQPLLNTIRVLATTTNTGYELTTTRSTFLETTAATEMVALTLANQTKQNLLTLSYIFGIVGLTLLLIGVILFRRGGYPMFKHRSTSYPSR